MVFSNKAFLNFFITYDTWLQVNKEGTRNVFSSASFGKEGIERINALAHRQVTGHLPIRLDAMLQAVQFPTGIAHLDASLTDMNRYDFPHLAPHAD